MEKIKLSEDTIVAKKMTIGTHFPNLKKFLYGFGMMAIMASCTGNSEEEYITSQTLDGLYAIAEDAQGKYTVLDAPTYKVEYNYTNSTVNLQLNSISLPDGTVYPTVKIDKAPFIYDKTEWKLTTLKDFTADVGTFGRKPTFLTFDWALKDLTFEYMGTGAYAPGFALSYQLDGYTVYSAGTTGFMHGTCTTATQGTTPYECTHAIFGLTVNPKNGIAALDILGIHFDPQMETLMNLGANVTFTGITAEFDHGLFLLKADKLTPKVDGKERPEYAVTNVKGSYDPRHGLLLDMDCAARNQQSHLTIDAGFNN